MSSFSSQCKLLARNMLPQQFQGLRIQHMPLVLGEPRTIPDFAQTYGFVLELVANLFPEFAGRTVYLTVDERRLANGQTLRRPGLHVDGWWKTETHLRKDCPEPKPKGGGFGGCEGPFEGTGLVTVSWPGGCKVYEQDFEGEPAAEGDCEHLRAQCKPETAKVLESGYLYWLSPTCVHESMPFQTDRDAGHRSFVRVSLPSSADWYDGCTPNGLGVLPTGRTRAKRRFMG